jgi:hypothetical protein
VFVFSLPHISNVVDDFSFEQLCSAVDDNFELRRAMLGDSATGQCNIHMVTLARDNGFAAKQVRRRSFYDFFLSFFSSFFLSFFFCSSSFIISYIYFYIYLKCHFLEYVLTLLGGKWWRNRLSLKAGTITIRRRSKEHQRDF